MVSADAVEVRLTWLREAHFAQETATADMAAEAFLRLLRCLRVTFLQDIIEWRQRLTESFFVWEHPLFSDPEFLGFETAARQIALDRVDSWDNRVKEAIPLMVDQVGGKLSGLNAEVKAGRREMIERDQRMQQRLEHLTTKQKERNSVIEAQSAIIAKLYTSQVSLLLPGRADCDTARNGHPSCLTKTDTAHHPHQHHNQSDKSRSSPISPLHFPSYRFYLSERRKRWYCIGRWSGGGNSKHGLRYDITWQRFGLGSIDSHQVAPRFVPVTGRWVFGQTIGHAGTLWHVAKRCDRIRCVA